jgi:hypothetical protein
MPCREFRFPFPLYTGETGNEGCRFRFVSKETGKTLGFPCSFPFGFRDRSGNELARSETNWRSVSEVHQREKASTAIRGHAWGSTAERSATNRVGLGRRISRVNAATARI